MPLTTRGPLVRRGGAAVIASLLAVLVWTSPRAARAHYERCSVVDGVDSCLPGEACSAKDGGAGACLPPPCQNDTDCRYPPLLQCDTRATQGVCVECYADNECAAPKFCELDPRSPASNRCVECQLGRASACDVSEAGHRCIIETGRCGCLTTVDCPTGTFCRRDACIPRPKAGPSDAAVEENGGGDGGAADGGGVSSPDQGTSGGCTMSPANAGAGLALSCLGVLALLALRRRARDRLSRGTTDTGRRGGRGT